ncbi:hypothetical protein [Nonomuraea typhae]|uniref:hypothetical protein n=1 Tax=Nonomuraea typhae TaxID=2603600 RepID=UPI0012FA1262|nr:hypothetical protein [Nonomuraea typhae]
MTVRRGPGGVLGRTLITGVLAGAVSGVTAGTLLSVSLLVVGLASPEASVNVAGVAGLLNVILIATVVGIPLGALMALPVALVLILAGGWAAPVPLRARLVTALASVAVVGAAEAIWVFLASSPWESPVLLGPPLVVAALTGSWRGPDLLTRRG